MFLEVNVFRSLNGQLSHNQNSWHLRT